MIKKIVKNFTELTRAYSLPVSLSAFFVALCWANFEQVNKLHAFLAFISVICLHLGGNLFDDILDVILRLKKGEKLSEINFCNSAKARLILSSTIPLKVALVLDALLFGIAILCGIYFFVQYGVGILGITAISAILILLYPISSKFFASEIIIGTLFGYVLPNACFYVMTGNTSLNLAHFSLSLAFLIVALAHAHSIMDWENDEKCGKKTLAMICQNKQNAIRALGWLIFCAYLNLGILVSLYYLNGIMIFACITIPIAVELINSMKSYVALEDRELRPRWFMGVMENWEEIKKQNMHYFMYRFYLARNLAVYFAIFCALARLIAINSPFVS